MTVQRPEPMGSELVIRDGQSNFSPAQRAALAQMGVDKAPEGDVQVFFHVCQRTGLDPFARQIYMIGREQSELRPDGKWQKVMKYTIQTGIDGYRTTARRNATAAEDDLAYGDMLWCGRDGVWRDVWLGEPHELYAAKATVYRAGKAWTHVALWREYVQTKRDGNPNTMWATKGANQLAKCAEAGALRKAFPQDFAHLYVDAEMDHLASEAAASQIVEGGRDWYADADATATIDDLSALWSAAHRAKQLDEPLQQHMRLRRRQLEHAEDVVDAEVVDEVDLTTGEVIHESGGAGGEAAKGGSAPSTPDAAPVRTPAKRATITALVRELDRCGVQPSAVDAYLPLLGATVSTVGELDADEAVALLEFARSLDRDKLAGMLAAAQTASGS